MTRKDTGNFVVASRPDVGEVIEDSGTRDDVRGVGVVADKGGVPVFKAATEVDSFEVPLVNRGAVVLVETRTCTSFCLSPKIFLSTWGARQGDYLLKVIRKWKRWKMLNSMEKSCLVRLYRKMMNARATRSEFSTATTRFSGVTEGVVDVKINVDTLDLSN